MGSASSTSLVPDVASKHFKPTMNKIPDSAFAGRSIAITGCSTGIGKEVALAAAERGVAQIFMLNRKSERATAAEQAVRTKAPASTKVMTIECDLQSFASVRTAAAVLKAETRAYGLDILLLNAAVMACNETATADGYDVQAQVSVLSHFLLTRECMPALELAARGRHGEARVVSQSSSARFGKPLAAKYFEKLGAPGCLGGNTRGIFSGGAVWERYHQAKAGNVVFTMALHDRLQAANSKVRARVWRAPATTRPP
jgi:NAD(P)-dependent dehydrogenase (short-subunit alcohol dehydrogenase family)